jgi:hypothetical protein
MNGNAAGNGTMTKPGSTTPTSDPSRPQPGTGTVNGLPHARDLPRAGSTSGTPPSNTALTPTNRVSPNCPTGTNCADQSTLPPPAGSTTAPPVPTAPNGTMTAP